MNDNEVRLIDANALCEEFKKRHRAALGWKEKAILADDEETKIRADAVLTFLSEVKLTIEDAPTADDWENYSTKLWKEAYEQGKADRPKGKWTVIGLVGDYAFCKCSECGNITRLYRDSKNEFCCIADIRNKVIACLYCGADMRKGGADNDT